MDAQMLEFAQRAVTALEAIAAPQPHWTVALGSVGGLAIGLVQCGLIYVGLRRMGQASEERKVQHEESLQTMQTQHEETMTALQQQGEERKTQHEETMTALQQQGEERKTQHEETMTALQQQGEERKTRHEETVDALQQQGAVLADIGAGIRELLRDRNG